MCVQPKEDNSHINMSQIDVYSTKEWTLSHTYVSTRCVLNQGKATVTQRSPKCMWTQPKKGNCHIKVSEIHVYSPPRNGHCHTQVSQIDVCVQPRKGKCYIKMPQTDVYSTKEKQQSRHHVPHRCMLNKV